MDVDGTTRGLATITTTTTTIITNNNKNETYKGGRKRGREGKRWRYGGYLGSSDRGKGRTVRRRNAKKKKKIRKRKRKQEIEQRHENDEKIRVTRHGTARSRTRWANGGTRGKGIGGTRGKGIA